MMKKMISLLIMVGLLVGCESVNTSEEVMYEDNKMKITVNEIVEEGKEDYTVKVLIENKTDETLYFGNLDENGACVDGTINGEKVYCSFVFQVEPYEIKNEEIYLNCITKEELLNNTLKTKN